MGAKAPSFSMETKTFTISREEHLSFALLCQAQAFPVPSMRFVWVVFLNLVIVGLLILFLLLFSQYLLFVLLKSYFLSGN